MVTLCKHKISFETNKLKSAKTGPTLREELNHPTWKLQNNLKKDTAVTQKFGIFAIRSDRFLK